MSSLNDDTNDAEEVLTKPKQKKQRSEAQIAATERMREALAKKSAPVATEKKMILKAIKEKLNGPSKNDIHEEEEEEEEDEPAPIVVKKTKKESKPEPEPVVVKKPPKKEPKVVYQSESESEEEVIVVKKKRKPKKKTIIYEESETEEEEVVAPKPKTRETKTQQNTRSVFKVSVPEVKPPAPLYYFA
jgi:hypothetical protein